MKISVLPKRGCYIWQDLFLRVTRHMLTPIYTYSLIFNENDSFCWRSFFTVNFDNNYQLKFLYFTPLNENLVLTATGEPNSYLLINHYCTCKAVRPLFCTRKLTIQYKVTSLFIHCTRSVVRNTCTGDLHGGEYWHFPRLWQSERF